MSDSTPALVAEGVCKSYGGVSVLEGVSLSVGRGGRLAVIGPNGSGKTTLLDVLAGFTRARSGRVRMLGRDVTGASVTRRARDGMARTFQIAAVVDEWTVYDNIAFATATQRSLGFHALLPLRRNSAVRADVLEAAARWELTDWLQAPITALPYGIVRRTELAIATLGDPRVLLLDEPAAGLASDEGQRVVEAVSELFVDAAIVLVEHDMDIVFGFCHELLVLDHGRIIASGDPETVKDSAEVAEAYFGRAVH